MGERRGKKRGAFLSLLPSQMSRMDVLDPISVVAKFTWTWVSGLACLFYLLAAGLSRLLVLPVGPHHLPAGVQPTR